MKLERSSALCAGTSKVDITPPVGIFMCGYGERTEGARGIHDPLFARVLVLKCAETSLAIVATDLVWLYSDRIVQEARAKWGLDHVILCGSHTHSGPNMQPSPWYSQMEDKIIAAIGEAAASLFPARMVAGMGPGDDKCFGYNRRLVHDDRPVQMLWSNPDKQPNGPTDPTVRLLRIEDEGGHPRVLFVNYAAHPVTLGSGNLYISADYPGPMVRRIEHELGPGCMAMFLQGAGGDVHPYDCVIAGKAGFEAVERNGVALAESVLRVLKSMERSSFADTASIRVKVTTLGMQRRDGQATVAEVGVMAVLINGDIALVVVSGEPFVQHQLDLAVQSPIPNTFLLGYAYFGAGIPLPTYLPSLQAVKDGGYGAAAGSANFLEIGAGERMIEEAVKSIRELVAGR